MLLAADILVNSAGEQHPEIRLQELEELAWEKTFRTNIFAMFQLIKSALPYLKKGARIISESAAMAGYPTGRKMPRQPSGWRGGFASVLDFGGGHHDGQLLETVGSGTRGFLLEALQSPFDHCKGSAQALVESILALPGWAERAALDQFMGETAQFFADGPAWTSAGIGDGGIEHAGEIAGAGAWGLDHLAGQPQSVQMSSGG